jgi:hypothetical protein
VNKQPSRISLILIYIIVSLVLVGVITSFCWSIIGLTSTKKAENTHTCTPLPKGFKDSDLVGTWIAKYFGGDAIDKLTIKADGTYKQIYSYGSTNFENDWQKWWIKYDSDGYIRLHLAGMRRCDDVESICNTLGGGLPAGEVAINPCKPEYIDYSNEIILFVTGYPVDVPRGIVLWQARLAGSDWDYVFRLQP